MMQILCYSSYSPSRFFSSSSFLHWRLRSDYR